ncbi:MAG: hypothetical protein QMB94_06235, partial [Phycisphaerales bacterium]
HVSGGPGLVSMNSISTPWAAATEESAADSLFALPAPEMGLKITRVDMSEENIHPRSRVPW